MIRIRLFGLGELNQRTFSGTRYPVETKSLIETGHLRASEISIVVGSIYVYIFAIVKGVRASNFV